MTNPILDITRDGYFRITPDMLSSQDIEFHPRKTELTLDELQKGVDGYIERVVIAEGGMEKVKGGPFGFHLRPRGTEADMWVNEEGKLKDLPINPLATAIAHVMGSLPEIDYIVGTILITCGKAREQPEDLSAEEV